MAVVYLHKRNDTNEVFYVGIGKTEKRAYNKTNRTQYWKNIVNKVGYTVDILVSETSWEDACKIEKLLIEKYGRKDLGLGNLVNLTDGGDGSLGTIVSNKTRQKLSKMKKGKTHTEEHKQNLSEARKGKKHAEETKQNIQNTLRNKEGIKGYTYHKQTNKFEARITVGGKKIYLGLFNTPSEAEEAYKNARIRYFT